MNKQKIFLYTDGSCLNNGAQSARGGWGVVLENDNKQLILNGDESSTTSQRMELKAVIEGLKSIKCTQKEIHIYTDSAYALNGCETWRYKWRLNGWRNSSNKSPVKNLDLWVELDALLEGRNVYFHKVKAHSGHPQNELADKLAVAASHGRVTRQYRSVGDYDFC